ncbi:hypothetical protein DICSQDRAFT_140592 [Dichomitus squalens LYAD-421 SS1]|uniref:Uncharacterized protein n=1 Tax=Dichomitus squalens (strain LYAD-421) TaxID=732165 RepID=R7SQA7_DICSQ|nr:uncharacterized protein DICSQDRAFT_140592 [Dichomitus squalens LYAD-421 SS1]EJF57147.1 hypothetical protein DICSQDRAFT_140592 [Dichomitus squalens LYAD-421 SS1]
MDLSGRRDHLDPKRGMYVHLDMWYLLVTWYLRWDHRNGIARALEGAMAGEAAP